jgi:tetratricopeptide (TPR) repeat protein
VYALNNLAECYYQQGRRDEAAGALAEAARAARWSINVLQQQQQQQQEELDHMTTALVKAMNNLGLLHYQAGDFDECLSLLDDALGAAENYSEDKDNFATIQMQIYYNIGLVLESMASKEVSATTADLEDLVNRAREMYKLAQDMVLRLIAKSTDGDLRRKYGEYTPRICVLVINKMALIGDPSARNGASQDSLLLRHEALHRRLDLSFREGLDGAELAAEINGIGAAYSDADEHLMALAMYAEGLRLEMAVLGPNNTNVLVTLNNIGQSNHIRGNYDAALSYYKKALGIRDGLSGHADLLPVTPTLFHNTALIHMHTGRHSDALSYFRASLSLQRAAEESGVTSCDKDVLASTLYNIGTIMADKGCLEEACKALTESIAIRSSTDSDDIDIAEAHAKLAQIHFARGKKMEALHSYKSILDLNLSTQDEACRSMIIQAFSNTAAICHSTGNLDESLNHYRSALDLLKAHSTNPSTDETLDVRTRTKIVSVLGAIAGIHSERGEVSEAESYYIERTRIQRVGCSDDETMAICGTNVAAPAA